jgi:hypothetical protein
MTARDRERTARDRESRWRDRESRARDRGGATRHREGTPCDRAGAPPPREGAARHRGAAARHRRITAHAPLGTAPSASGPANPRGGRKEPAGLVSFLPPAPRAPHPPSSFLSLPPVGEKRRRMPPCRSREVRGPRTREGDGPNRESSLFRGAAASLGNDTRGAIRPVGPRAGSGAGTCRDRLELFKTPLLTLRRRPSRFRQFKAGRGAELVRRVLI